MDTTTPRNNTNEAQSHQHVAFQQGTLRILLDSSCALLTGVQSGTIQPALFTWPCARAIAKTLHNYPSLVRGRRVLELGAGTCVAGMTAAALGARQVVLSDQTEDKALFDAWKRACVANVALNSQVECCQVAGIEWGDMTNEIVLAGGFDILLGADLVYQTGDHDDSDTENILLALFSTVAAVLARSSPDAFMLLAVQDRDTGHALLAHEAAQHCGLCVSSWPTTDGRNSSSDLAQENVRLVRLCAIDGRT